MATFSAGFLGCKVSHADAQAVLERLLADGHTAQEGGADIAVLNTPGANARSRVRHRLWREPRRFRLRRAA